MNLDFQGAINEPVMITCPPISTKSVAENDSSSVELNVASSKEKPRKKKSKADPVRTILAPREISDISAESCSSFLLDYVNSRSEHISNGIRNPDEEFGDNAADLKNLLEKVNLLKSYLQEAIMTYQGKNSEQLKENMRFVLHEMENLNKEENKLRNDGREDRTKKISKEKKLKSNKEINRPSENLTLREKMLHYKEQCFEEKLKELYSHEKKLKEDAQKSKASEGRKVSIETVKTKNLNRNNNINGDVSNASSDAPVKIVINVNQKNARKMTRSEVKWSDLIQQTGQPKKTPLLTKVNDEPSAKFPKTPTKVSKRVVTNFEQTSSTSTTFTAYLSPPHEVDTALTKALRNNKQQITNTQQVLKGTTEAQLDPQLVHYITRLLAMSRNSVDQLGVSSASTVATPGSSIIETATNNPGQRHLEASSLSMSEPSLHDALSLIDEQKIEQLNKFIRDNQCLVNELNQSLKSMTLHDKQDSNSEAPEENRRVNNVWMEILKSKEMDIDDHSQAQKGDQPQIENDSSNQPPPSHYNRAELINQYNDLAAHFTQRITDLDTMITKVREEKQKLLENTLSSAGSLINNPNQREIQTEYMDLPQQPLHGAKNTSASAGDTSQGSDVISLPTTSPEYSSSGAAAVANITALGVHSKQIGISKDSGVGVSRPITASDFRDSPEFRPNEPAKPIEGVQKLKEAFEPMLKDIPKVNYKLMDVASNSSPSQTVLLTVQPMQMQGCIAVASKGKHPPPALAR